jgi:tetratricopeptide (TPR) repeat protein
MPLMANMPQDPTLAAPRDSQTANPAAANMSPTGSTARESHESIALIELRVEAVPFRGRKLADPRQAESRQYLEDTQAGFVAQALALVTKAPRSAVAWARYAQTLIANNKVDEAVRAAKQTLSLLSDHIISKDYDVPSVTAKFLAARVLAASGNVAAAEATLGGLPRAGPWTVLHAALAEGRGDHDQALARLGDAESAEALAFRGYLLLQLNRSHPALRQLRAARKTGGDSPILMMNLAYGYAIAGSPSKAVRAAQQAVAMAPADRRASFNLVSYLRAAGRAGDALVELLRLRAACGDGDPQVAAAIADVYVELGNCRQALRELRRAQHHNSFRDSSVEQAELIANTALLEWQLGERRRASVAAVIRLQLQKVGAHLPLALMLADVIGQTNVSGEIETIYSELQEELSERELRPLKIRLLMLKRDLEGSARSALEHLIENPLDVRAARGAVVLHGQVFGDYDGASEIGMKALRRLPGDRDLINNVAFSLALAGHGDEAGRIFVRDELDNQYLLATRGLIDFALGNIASGLASYDEAAQFARSHTRRSEDADEFVQLMRVQEVLALYQLGHESSPKIPQKLRSASVPRTWYMNVNYLVYRRIAERLNVPWVTGETVTDS